MSMQGAHPSNEVQPEVMVLWESNCAGEIFASEGPEAGVRIGHFQGDAALAAYVVNLHNDAIRAQGNGNALAAET